MPSNRFFVSVVGMLTDVAFIHGDRHQGIEHFHFTVRSIPLDPKGFFEQAGMIGSGSIG